MCLSFLRPAIICAAVVFAANFARAAVPCGQVDLRLGLEAGEFAALAAAERGFLGGIEAPAMAEVTVVSPGQDLSLGLCGEDWRAGLHIGALRADLPKGLGIFTDPTKVRGQMQGLQVEAQRWVDLGRMRAGIGLGLQADWTRVQVRSAFLDVKGQAFTLSVPVTLRLRYPLGQGGIDLWLRRSFASDMPGTAFGLGLSQSF